MKKVITYGTFDTIHFGHLKLLERAKNLGDFLIVGLSTDEFNALKGKKSLLNYSWPSVNIKKSLPFGRLFC